jgi:hypothetical protein
MVPAEETVAILSDSPSNQDITKERIPLPVLAEHLRAAEATQGVEIPAIPTVNPYPISGGGGDDSSLGWEPIRSR